MNDSQLILLISQPRSGSSLLQQLILDGQRISSSPESWQMLALINTYKVNNITQGYNPQYASINFLKHLDSKKDGVSRYKEKIKELAIDLYELELEGEEYFLDKTPRYYHVIEELYELFPNAKFIFLVRNPLSVFSSILDYNFHGDHAKMLKSQDRIEDLFTGPRKIMDGIQYIPNSLLVSYEKIIETPEDSLDTIFNYLGLPLNGFSGSYELENKFSTSSSIDTKSLNKHNSPVDHYLASWKKVINTTQKKILAIEYLTKLKNSHASYFEYDIDAIIQEVKSHTITKKTYFNLSFNELSKSEENLSFRQVLKKRVYLKLQRKFVK